MAYMNQEEKTALAPNIKAVLKKYGVKGSIAVRNFSTLIVNIKSGGIDFIGNYNETCLARTGDRFTRNEDQYIDVNPYWYTEHFSGKALSFLKELFTAMNAGNHNRSDVQTDYFDIGWYVDVNVGSCNKPYVIA